MGARFDHVLVDEYQDTNRLQAAILRALKPDGRGLTVVGDDAQSIYSLPRRRGAQHPRFPGAVRSAGARCCAERNYRSTQPLLATPRTPSSRWPAERFAKTLWSDRGGAKPQLVHGGRRDGAGALGGRRSAAPPRGGLPLKSQAVLFRTGHHSAALELELTRRGIPFVKYGGLQVPGGGAREGPAVGAALGAEPALPAGGLSRRAAGARHRPGRGAAPARHDGRQADPADAVQAMDAAPAAGRDWHALARVLAAHGAIEDALAGRSEPGRRLVQAAAAAPARTTRACAAPTWTSSSAWPPATRAASAS
jgi:DNA helicase-2/ATP-dependent DNA helicase PcrA